jgi:hypothetical protein
MRSIFHQQLWGIAMTGRQLAAPFVEPRASLIQVVSCLLRATAGLLSCYCPRIQHITLSLHELSMCLDFFHAVGAHHGYGAVDCKAQCSGFACLRFL